MKKIIAVLLSLILSAAMTFPVLADQSLAGGWNIPEEIIITDDAKAALEEAMNGFVGSSITPVALLGTQVVAGLNYCLLCKVTPVVPNAQAHYALVYIYRPLSGSAQILDIEDLDISPDYDDDDDDENEYDLILLESIGTIEPEEGTTGKTYYCVDGYTGDISFAKGEAEREDFGFELDDFDRLLLKDDVKVFVPVDLMNPVENMELNGAEEFENWWMENIAEKKDPSELIFRFTKDQQDFVTVLEYIYLP